MGETPTPRVVQSSTLAVQMIGRIEDQRRPLIAGGCANPLTGPRVGNFDAAEL